jgi:hypothetical protein
LADFRGESQAFYYGTGKVKTTSGSQVHTPFEAKDNFDEALGVTPPKAIKQSKSRSVNLRKEWKR